VDQLLRAVNEHDLDAVVSCFADDYANETPAHPRRGFRGAEQVRRNWTQLFAGMPDLTARLLLTSVDGDTIWTEQEMSGTRPDGTIHVMRGVVIFGVTQRRLGWARFYLEPVEESTGGVDAAIQRAATGGDAP
jgi:ketosteroid isomerase-like protein